MQSLPLPSPSSTLHLYQTITNANQRQFLDWLQARTPKMKWEHPFSMYLSQWEFVGKVKGFPGELGEYILSLCIYLNGNLWEKWRDSQESWDTANLSWPARNINRGQPRDTCQFIYLPQDFPSRMSATRLYFLILLSSFVVSSLCEDTEDWSDDVILTQTPDAETATRIGKILPIKR
jgi:hypothetical protein